MHNRLFLPLVIVLAMLMSLTSNQAFCASTVDTVSRYSWSGNIGWLDWYNDDTDGADFTPIVLSGYVYSANIGWIYLGSGAPASGTQYSNTTDGDCGVNVDATNDPNYFILSGYGYAANAGWINFNVPASNQPRIDKKTSILQGFVWSANIGWLPLNSSPLAQVETGLIAKSGAADWTLYE